MPQLRIIQLQPTTTTTTDHKINNINNITNNNKNTTTIDVCVYVCVAREGKGVRAEVCRELVDDFSDPIKVPLDQIDGPGVEVPYQWWHVCCVDGHGNGGQRGS